MSTGIGRARPLERRWRASGRRRRSLAERASGVKTTGGRRSKPPAAGSHEPLEQGSLSYFKTTSFFTA
jgi:hypothetical protein